MKWHCVLKVGCTDGVPTGSLLVLGFLGFLGWRRCCCDIYRYLVNGSIVPCKSLELSSVSKVGKVCVEDLKKGIECPPL